MTSYSIAHAFSDRDAPAVGPRTSDRVGQPRDTPPSSGASAPHERAIQALERTFEIARSQLDAEASLPAPSPDPDAARAELGIGLQTEGRPFEVVGNKLARLLAHTPAPASPRFLNQLYGGRDDVGTMAEMLTPLANTSMYTYKVAGPQVLVEQEVLDRMCAKVGFTHGEGMFAPGGSIANLTALLIARNRAFPTAREHGYAPDHGGVCVYTSADGHYSIQKAAGILGLGRQAVRTVPTDERGAMDPSALERMIRQDIEAGCRPLFVNATAGTTVLGAFDPVHEIAAVASEFDVWLHVDGALGGSVLLSERHQHLLEGSELADSFAWNAHKMMGVPLSCSALLLRETGALAANLGEVADYLFHDDAPALDPGTRSLQCGRRNDALKLWAAWQFHGDEGYDQRIDTMFDLARYAARAVEADGDLELVGAPVSVNVCLVAPGVDSGEVCDLLHRTGRLLIGHGKVRGQRAIRLVCLNPDLTASDIDAALDEIRWAVTTLRKGDAK